MRRWWRSRVPDRLVVGLIAMAAAVVLWAGPSLQVELTPGLGDVDATRLFWLENEARKTLAQLIGGAFVLWGGYVTWRTLQLGQENQRIARDAQLTDRFSKAIEQLGSTSMDVRLGGIYALERIAHDSRRDHGTVMEVLCAFVRRAIRWMSDEDRVRWERSALVLDLPREALDLVEDSQEAWRTVYETRVAEDFRASLDVVSRRNREFDPPGARLGLRGVDLRGVNLYRANLDGADFRGAKLAWAVFSNASLRVADFSNVVAQHASFIEADLTRAGFLEADLGAARFEKANLRGAVLIGANVRNAGFGGSDLRGATAESVDGDPRSDQFRGARVDATTKLPKGVTVPPK